MFRKQIKIKSNTQLKGSFKRKLFSVVLKTFKILTEEDVNNIFPKKENISEVRVFSKPQNLTASVYTVCNVPLLIEINNRLLPTIFLLWQYPNIVPCVTVHESVIERLVNGADLMIPGLRDVSGSVNPVFNVNDVLGISTQNNRAALAVGFSFINSSSKETHGKAVNIVHTISDDLCKMASPAPVMPIIPFHEDKQSCEGLDVVAENLEVCSIADKPELDEATVTSENEKPLPDFDKVLWEHFFIGLVNIPKDDIPILSNIFYCTHILSTIDPEIEFDIKKTSYKKVSNFLKIMAGDKVITMEDVKGVQSITAINYQDPNVIRHLSFKRKPEVSVKTSFKIDELYKVTTQTAKVLKHNGFEKGDEITPAEVRSCVAEYVKFAGLENMLNQRLLILDDALRSAANVKGNVISWKLLYDRFFAELKSIYEIQMPNGEKIKKNTKLLPIIIKVASRCSNKKVTIVSNLSLYGIDLKSFSHICQLTIAASTTIIEKGEKDLQFQIQGNQSYIIRNILLNDYQIPHKYVIGGIEKPSKKKF